MLSNNKRPLLLIHIVYVMAVACSMILSSNAFGIELTLPAGRPSTFKIERLWGTQIANGRESMVYRFNTQTDFEDAQAQTKEWLAIGAHPVQSKTENGWSYLSNFVQNVWLTVQLRRAGQSNKVEGLITVWRAATNTPTSMTLQISSLQKSTVLKESLSRDHQRVSQTLVVVSDDSVMNLAQAIASDLQRLGFARTPYSPVALKGQLLKGFAGSAAATAQAWSSSKSNVVFSVFEHSGKTAVTLFWTTHGL